MAYKTFFKSTPSVKKAGVGYIKNSAPLKADFTSASDELGLIQLNGISTSGFNINDLVNIRYSDDSPSIDTTVSVILGDTILTTAPFTGVVLGGVLSQRFNPPKKAG